MATSNRKKAKRRKSSPKLPPELRRVHLDAAGIDVGAESHWVAVPEGRDPEGRGVREFGAFTADLYALADWLATCGVTTVAMESTGVYWIPLFELLESQGFEVLLVNPRHLKSVPGRKTDVLDCQWLQRLHTYGLLQGSFRPEEQVCVLRAYLRQRQTLVRYAASHVQHMQKALDQMNIKLHKVVSDITGVTGLRIIRAILEGERDPRRLAQLRDPRCKNSEETIAKALEGTWREEHLFSLRQALTLYETYRAEIAACDQQIQAHLGTFDSKDDDPPAARTAPRSRQNVGAITFDVGSHLRRITGVDLTEIDGIDAVLALTIISEIGLDMNRWRTVKHFTSWLGLCPGSKISGGKRLDSRTKPTSNRAAMAFRMAANALHRSDSALGAFLRRKKAHIGAPKAITATAHKLARIVYTMLRHGRSYTDLGADYYEARYRGRVLNNLRRKANALGYSLIENNNLDQPPCPQGVG